LVGADDRAHNRWAGRDLVIAGVPTVSPTVAEDWYLAERAWALSAGAPPEEWPEWTPKRVKSGNRMVSAEPAIREWDDARLAGDLAQAIDHCRPLDNPNCTVLLLGPAIDLAEHGITVTTVTSATESAAARRKVAHLTRLHRLARVAAKLERNGERITRQALRSEGANGRSSLYTELVKIIRQFGNAREAASFIKDELAGVTATSGWKAEVGTSTPDKHGRTRVIVRVVPNEAWLAATGHTVVYLTTGRQPRPVRPRDHCCVAALGP
jgi:hypothetical protein